MKKSYILVFVFALGLSMVACSGGASDKNESAAAETSSSVQPVNSENVNELAFEKLMKNLTKRGISLSETQKTELMKLVESSGVNPDNFKEKRQEIVNKIKSEILTEDQKSSLSK
jgi:hypothetical protein